MHDLTQRGRILHSFEEGHWYLLKHTNLCLHGNLILAMPPQYPTSGRIIPLETCSTAAISESCSSILRHVMLRCSCRAASCNAMDHDSHCSHGKPCRARLLESMHWSSLVQGGVMRWPPLAQGSVLRA